MLSKEDTMRTRAYILAAVTVVTLLAGIGRARTTDAATTTYPVVVSCNGYGSGQPCQPYAVTVATAGVLQAQFTAGPAYCSTIRVHMYVDGVLEYTSPLLSPFLTTGPSTGLVNLGPVSPGSHVLSLRIERYFGLCPPTGNTPVASGTLRVVTSDLVGPPTDRDQCKNGGWQRFNNPEFDNQGDCVSYVNTSD
jgi:hypothetical protein